MKPLLTAIILASGLFSAPVFAQDAAMTMDVGLSMLELSAQRELTQYGVHDFDVMKLTLNQLSEIKYVASTSDYSDNEKKLQIKKIVGIN